jgi:hypothetical protein
MTPESRERVLTSHIMVESRAAAYLWIMLATSPSALRSEPHLASQPAVQTEPDAPRALPAILVLGLFLPFSLWVVYASGPVGLYRVIRHEPWGAQLFFDLCISAFIAGSWMVGDARRRRITVWPFVVATALTGSVGLLSYLVRRSLSPAPAARR